MDRGEGIIRWSPSQARDEFLTLEINYRVIQRYQAIGRALPERFDYRPTSKHNDFQIVTAFDWSSKVSGLVAIGGKGGEVQLLRIDDDSNDCITLPLKLQRTCQAVAFNTTGLLAVGLDRVRNDQCLQIWDVDHRLSKWDPSKKGWQSSPNTSVDPLYKLEPSVSVTSVKFFEDQPQTVVVGVKNQSVRIHDLRDPHGAVVTFQTRCNNNLAIDHADPNYFASSALDQPGVMVWDRRATSRQVASKMYLDSIDAGELPFGCALKVSNTINHRNGSYIRSLRYCRDQRGLLAILSSSGELQVLRTEREFVEPQSENDLDETPELLEVKESYPLQYPFFDENFGCPHDDRVVSSDWATLGSSSLQPRLVTRRSSQKLGVMLMPTRTQHLAFDLINFAGSAKQDEYTSLPRFNDSSEAEFVLGPIVLTETHRNAVFRSGHDTRRNMNGRAMGSTEAHVLHSKGLNTPHPTLEWISTSSSNFNSIIKTTPSSKKAGGMTDATGRAANLLLNDLSISGRKSLSSREQHEHYHWQALESSNLATPAYAKLNQMFLRRCEKGYLFNCVKNQEVLSGDPWLQDVWLWIEGADEIVREGGMVSGRLDLNYMGVSSVWKNDLGNKYNSRLIDTVDLPSDAVWDETIATIKERAELVQFESVQTHKPHHRQLCLAISGWGKPTPELDKDLAELEAKGLHTKAAAWALYEKLPERAVEILKRGSNDLLFIALALNLHLKGAQSVDKNDWDAVLQKHPQMMADPYLRAIYALISTGDWKAIADEDSLPLRDRVGVAVRNLDDAELNFWLEKQLAEAIKSGDVEGIVLAGITDKMVDILARYVDKFGDYQTATLIMSHAAPLYVTDYRCSQWREKYRDFLNANKLHIDRCKFDVQSTRKSRRRDGTTVIKPPPRQVTLRCVRCDTALTNDRGSTAHPPPSMANSSVSNDRNPLYPSGVNAGISCPKCGRHLGRCAVCLQTLGMPRADRPELSTEKQSVLGNFMTFCLKCDHACHADHSQAWFSRHNECPAPDCRCLCNEQDIRMKAEYEARKRVGDEETMREERAMEEARKGSGIDGGGD